MPTVIVYYSRNNNTRAAAGYLAGKLKAQLIELRETREYKGPFGFIRAIYHIGTGKSYPLKGEPWLQIDSFKIIYLMTPIWGGRATPAVKNLLQQSDLKGKEVTVVTLQADKEGEGSSKVHENLKELIEKSGGIFKEGFALHSAPPGKFAGKEHIENQVDKIL